MGEIKTELKKLNKDDIHKSTGDEYVITEDHSLSDVIRWLIKQSDIDEIIFLLEHEKTQQEKLDGMTDEKIPKQVQDDYLTCPS